MDESRLRKAFKCALKDAKLPAFRVYDLRHTYASLLLAERAPITYVAAQLGHANASTTLRYYAKWIPSKGQRWADLLDRVTTSVRDTVSSAAEGLASAVGSILGTKIWNQNEIGEPRVAQLPDSIGGPSRTRTLDPLIKGRQSVVSLIVPDHHKSPRAVASTSRRAATSSTASSRRSEPHANRTHPRLPNRIRTHDSTFLHHGSCEIVGDCS